MIPFKRKTEILKTRHSICKPSADCLNLCRSNKIADYIKKHCQVQASSRNLDKQKSLPSVAHNSPRQDERAVPPDIYNAITRKLGPDTFLRQYPTAVYSHSDRVELGRLNN